MHWPSFLCFNASIVFEAFRMVLSERLLGRGRFDVFNALIYMGPITFTFLSIGSYAFEWRQGLATEVRWLAGGAAGRLLMLARHAMPCHASALAKKLSAWLPKGVDTLTRRA